jgi:hypothetical protein
MEMSVMRTLAVRRRRSLKDCLQKAVDFKPPLMKGDHKLFTAFDGAKRRFDEVARGLAQLCIKHCSFSLNPPAIETVGAEVAALPYNEAIAAVEQRLNGGIDLLCQRLTVPQLGHIEWLDDETCKFTYFQVDRKEGFVRDTLYRVAHTHHLVNARMHRLPAAEVAKPKKALAIIESLPPALYPYARIVTGLEVVNATAIAEQWKERNAFGEFLHDVGLAATSVPAIATAGIAAGAGALAGLGWLGLAAAQVAIVDPAIILGELCLFGWEN